MDLLSNLARRATRRSDRTFSHKNALQRIAAKDLDIATFLDVGGGPRSLVKGGLETLAEGPISFARGQRGVATRSRIFCQTQ